MDRETRGGQEIQQLRGSTPTGGVVEALRDYPNLETWKAGQYPVGEQRIEKDENTAVFS